MLFYIRAKNVSCILASYVFLVSATLAGPAYLVTKGEQAQAFIFSHRSQCYAVMPNHVSKRDRFSLKGGIPEKQGNGKMTSLRFPDSDLALAVVTGPLAQNCTPTWSNLPRDVTAFLPSGGGAVLETVRSNGLMERVDVVMSPISYEHIGITPTVDRMKGRLGKGRSGSVLVSNGTPVGIAIEVPRGTNSSQGEVRVLRMDAIVARLDRFLTGRQVLSTATTQTKNTKSSQIIGEIPFVVADWNYTPTTPENDPTNLAIDGAKPFLTEPLSRILKIDLNLSDDKAVPVKEIMITSDSSDTTFTAPKGIKILVSNSEDKSRARSLGSAEMSPDGRFSLRLGTQKMRWILIRISSSWEPNKPLRIDEIRLQ